MCDQSVVDWLKQLRNEVEYYDKYDNLNFSARYCGNNMDFDAKRASGSYENIWECDTAKELINLRVNFANICRVSVHVFDSVEELKIQPKIFQQITFEISEDVMLWKNNLRHTYCGEDENILEHQEILSNLKHEKTESTHTISDCPSFPPVSEEDEPVALRQRIKDWNTRPKTFSTPTSFSFNLEGVSKATITKKEDNRPDQIYFTYESGHFYWCPKNENKKTQVDVKQIRLLNKKEAELKDSQNNVFNITFESPKYAKQFIENDKFQNFTNCEKLTITARLLNLLGKRSSKDLLEKRGIYKDEPIFGNTLEHVYSIHDDVPKFVKECVDFIEMRENITCLGLYRTSGNLATIQKIRLEVDNGNLNILKEFSRDADVLTGCLKLFFRELKGQLIVEEVVSDLTELISTKSEISTQKQKEKLLKILKTLPEPNLKTLMFLIAHLIKVVRHKEENKMDNHNLSVCWGPSLIFYSVVKDMVSQVTLAGTILEFLLDFYTDNPQELGTTQKEQNNLDDNKNQIKKYPSRDSIRSNETISKMKGSSTLNLDNTFDVVKKLVDLIEFKIDTDGLYRKSGNSQKIDKIMKKISKNKLNDIDKYKSDVHELTGALKRYIRELPDLIPKRYFDEFMHICDISNPNKKLIEFRKIVDEIPRKEALLYLRKHILKIFETERHKPQKETIINSWIENINKDITDKTIRVKFYKYFLDHYDDELEEIKLPEARFRVELKDLESKKEKKKSRYDNVDSQLYEANFLDTKTESNTEHNTKL